MNALKNTQRGTTLIEVLVAILVTATGVMGAASMQINSLKFNQTAKFRSSAVFLANDIADRLRANRGQALGGSYDIAVDDEAPSGDTTAQVDLRDWLAELSRRMPAGDGEIVRDGNRFVISVSWSESRVSKTREKSADNAQVFEFVTEL